MASFEVETRRSGRDKELDAHTTKHRSYMNDLTAGVESCRNCPGTARREGRDEGQ